MAATRLPEHDAASIVLLGSFNPKIYQPAWLAGHGLISNSEGTEANIQVISNDVCIYELAWCRIEVLNDRWALRSLATPILEALFDLAVGVFDRLPDEGIGRVGFNSHSHYMLADADMHNAVGHDLAPKQKYWDEILDKPGMASLTIRGVRPDSYQGAVNVKVEPSAMIQNGIFVEVNDEYVIDQTESSSSAAALKILRDDWGIHRERVDGIRQHIVDTAWGLL